MMRARPIIALFLVIGSGVSFGQPKSSNQNPFEIYQSLICHKVQEDSFIRFARTCELDLSQARVRYAVKPDEDWKIVTSLTHAQDEQLTDFFATVAVWSQGHSVVVERWYLDNMDSSFDITRNYICLKDDSIQSFEVINWANINENENSPAHWLGYEQRFKRKTKSEFSVAALHYVDAYGTPVQATKKDQYKIGTYEVFPHEFSWRDLKLPDEMLK